MSAAANWPGSPPSSGSASQSWRIERQNDVVFDAERDEDRCSQRHSRRRYAVNRTARGVADRGEAAVLTPARSRPSAPPASMTMEADDSRGGDRHGLRTGHPLLDRLWYPG